MPLHKTSDPLGGHLLLGQRGPLTERGVREIIAKLGQVAKLASPLGPHDLLHTFAKSLPAIQQLLGHVDIATTTIYTRVTADDLARLMGMTSHHKTKLHYTYLYCSYKASSLT